MPLSLETRNKIRNESRVHPTDSGSPEVQVAFLTERMNDLNGHLKNHEKDNHSRRGLLLMVGRRNRLLRYLARTDHDRCVKLITRLGLRK
jgi:small subunit ribosomal protein S15